MFGSPGKQPDKWRDTFVSNRALTWAFSANVPPHAKFVLVALADRANDSGYCFPSIADLAGRTCLARDRVSFFIQCLENAGIIRVERGSGRTVNRYALSIGMQFEAAIRFPAQGRRGAKSAAKSERFLNDVTAAAAAHVTSADGVTCPAGTLIEPSYNPHSRILTDTCRDASHRRMHDTKLLAFPNDGEVDSINRMQSDITPNERTDVRAAKHRPSKPAAGTPRPPAPSPRAEAWPTRTMRGFARREGVDPGHVAEAIEARWGRPPPGPRNPVWDRVFYATVGAAVHGDELESELGGLACEMDDLVFQGDAA
jgi:Helix-turn-helix domain